MVVGSRGHGRRSGAIAHRHGSVALSVARATSCTHRVNSRSANLGPLTEAAPEGPLLEALRNWIFRSHANLFTANDPGAEHVTLRHAYDYLWWRGFLEGAPDKPTRSFVAFGL